MINRSRLYLAVFFLLLLSIPLGTYLVKETQIFKGRAAETQAVSCDGNSDQIKIMAAINALPAAGGTVTLPGRQCNLTGPIILKANVTLEGQGATTKLFKASNFNNHMITNLNVRGKVAIRKMELNGDNQGSSGIELGNAPGSLLEDLYIHFVSFHAIALRSGSHNSKAQRIRTEEIGDGVFVVADSSGVEVADSQFRNSGRGVVYGRSPQGRIVRVTVENTLTQACIGVFPYDQSNGLFLDQVTVNNCAKQEGFGNNAIQLEVSNSRINSVRASGAFLAAVSIFGSNNVITDIQASNYGNNGIDDGLVFEGMVWDSGGYGVSKNNRVDGGVFDGRNDRASWGANGNSGVREGEAVELQGTVSGGFVGRERLVGSRSGAVACFYKSTKNGIAIMGACSAEGVYEVKYIKGIFQVGETVRGQQSGATLVIRGMENLVDQNTFTNIRSSNHNTILGPNYSVIGPHSSLDTVFSSNTGYNSVTKQQGIAIVRAGTRTVTVSHNLRYPPQTITLNANDATVTSKTWNNFIITLPANTTVNRQVTWYADRGQPAVSPTLTPTLTLTPTPIPTQITLNISPTNGLVGTTVNFTANIRGNKTVKLINGYQWWNRHQGDGTYTNNPTYTHTYTAAGIYLNPAVRVYFTDETVEQVYGPTITITTSMVTPTNTPTPTPTSTPTKTPTPTSVITTTLTPTPTLEKGDTNGDGKIDFVDLSVLFTKFGQNVPSGNRADLNNDGVVNTLDYSILKGIFIQRGLINP